MSITFNPADKDSTITLSNGDLSASGIETYTNRGARVTEGKSFGKWYFEAVITGSSQSGFFGLIDLTSLLTNAVGTGPNDAGFTIQSGASYKRNNGSSEYLGDFYESSPWNIGVAVDFATGNIWFRINGDWGGGDPVAGTGASYEGVITGTKYVAWSSDYYEGTCDLKLTPATVQYSVPEGYSGWGDPPTARATGTSTASAAGFADKLGGAGYAAGSSTCAGAGTGIFPDARVSWNSQDKHSAVALSNGGFKASASGGKYGVRATKYRDRGKLYFEIDVTGSNASAGLAEATYPISTSDEFIGSADSLGVRWSSSGTVEYESPQLFVYSQGFPQPLLYRFAIDFEAGRMWIGDQNGWRSGVGGYDGDPSLGVNPTFFDVRIGRTACTPAFSADVAASTGFLRAALHDLRYPIPAGFMPWDDYLNIGLAKGSASGSGVATGNSVLGDAAAQGSGIAEGASARLVAAVGVATGIGAGTAATSLVTGAAEGISTAAGFGSPTKYSSTANSVSTSAAIATSVRAGTGVGSSVGVAVPYIHSLMRELNAATTSTLSTSPPVDIDYTLTNGSTLFGLNADYLAVLDDSNSVAITTTWASNKIINGIELYSSAWCDVRFIGSSPDGTETFPAGVGGAVDIRIEYDTTGGSVYADVLPIIYNNNQIRRTVIFPDWLATKRIRVTVTTDSDYLRLQELKILTPSILYEFATEDIVVEASTLLAVYGVEFLSSAEATDTLIGTGYAKLESTAQATSTEASTWTVRVVGAASSKATVSGKMLLQEVLVSSGSATATVTTARPLEFVSEGMFFTKLSGDLTHSEESTGDAADAVQSEKSITRTEESTGVANATVIGIRRVTIVEISNGGSVASDTSGGASTLTLSSLGQAVSIAVQSSFQSVTLESIGNALGTLPFPHQGAPAISYPIFWTNSVSAGAATWTGLPFNSFIEADGVVYAAGPAGVFELDDESGDLGADVASEVEWDLVDSGSVQMKRMRSMYVNARAESPFTVRVANEQGVFDYTTTLTDTDTVTNHRAAVGRGIVSRNARLSLLHTKHYVAEDAGVGILESKRRI